MRALASCCGLMATALASVSPALCDPVADFYRGKQVSLVLSTGAGGGYASYAHAFAPYLSKHIPGNPTIVVQNLPGAGGLRAMQYFASVAPRDGSVLGLVHSSVPFAPLTVENLDQFKLDVEEAIGANPIMNPIPLGRGKEGAARLELAYQQAPYAQYFLSDPDFTLIGVATKN